LRVQVWRSPALRAGGACTCSSSGVLLAPPTRRCRPRTWLRRLGRPGPQASGHPRFLLPMAFHRIPIPPSDIGDLRFNAGPLTPRYAEVLEKRLPDRQPPNCAPASRARGRFHLTPKVEGSPSPTLQPFSPPAWLAKIEGPVRLLSGACAGPGGAHRPPAAVAAARRASSGRVRRPKRPRLNGRRDTIRARPPATGPWAKPGSRPVDGP